MTHRNNQRNPTDFQDSSQEQLQSLIAIAEQYSENHKNIGSTLITINGDMISIEQLYGKTFESVLSMLRDIESNPELRAESALLILHQLFKSSQISHRMLRELTERVLVTGPQISKQLKQTKSLLQQLEESLEDKDLCIEELREKIAKQQGNFHQISQMYERSKHENQELSEKINIKEQQFETQSKDLKRTFMEVQESNEMQKKIVEQLYENNEQMLRKINEAENEKVFIEQQFEKVSKDNDKLNDKILMLEQELAEKVRGYEQEIAMLQANAKKSDAKQVKSVAEEEEEGRESFIRESFAEQVVERSQSKMKLSEEVLDYKLPTNMGSFIGRNNRNSMLRKSIGEESDYLSEYEQASENMQEQAINSSFIRSRESFHRNGQAQAQKQGMASRKAQLMDPYYSHYILTSQAVKIKQDCQQMLNVDMKPYYCEIIDKRIPMHLWDQWIKNRLREEIRKNL